MKEFACGAVVPDCTAKITGSSEHDVLVQVAEHAQHAQRDHGMHTVPPEVVERVRLHIREAA